MNDKKKAVVLSSGGLDSTTVIAIAQSEGYEVYSLSFSYGQRHSFELEAAKKIAEISKVKKHLVIDCNMNGIGGSALTDNIDVPKSDTAEISSDDIPVTYVPARNTIFLSFALAWAETLASSDIFIGVNALDYSGYPDCRPEFIEAYENMANFATKVGVENPSKLKIHTPLIKMTKAEIIKTGHKLGVDYSLTHSCYDPSPEGLSCKKCDSCILRIKGFNEAGLPDPTKYIPY